MPNKMLKLMLMIAFAIVACCLIGFGCSDDNPVEPAKEVDLSGVYRGSFSGTMEDGIRIDTVYGSFAMNIAMTIEDSNFNWVQESDWNNLRPLQLGRGKFAVSGDSIRLNDSQIRNGLFPNYIISGTYWFHFSGDVLVMTQRESGLLRQVVLQKTQN